MVRITGSRSRVAILGVLVVFSLPAVVEAGNAYADAVLEALAKKGLLTAQEVHDIKLEARQAEAREQPLATPETGETDTDRRLLAKAANSVAESVKPAPGFPSYRVWGRLQPRFTYVPSEEGREGTSSFTFRRARIGLKGYLADKMPFRYQYEASNEIPGLSNATNLLDAWVGFEHFRDQLGDVIVGQQFVPGYTRPPQLSASVERKFSEVLYPGAAGRGRGITLRRGDMGLPESVSKGRWNNRIQYGLGLFNGPDLSLNNDNNEMLFAAVVGLRPTGQSVWPDEYAIKKRGFNYGLNAAYANSRDTTTLDSGVQAALGNPVELDNNWYSLFADMEYQHWFGWASWTRFVSDARDGLVLDTDGLASDSLDSSAWTMGASRTFPIRGNPDIAGWALALQYQQVDNEHPSRSRFFRDLSDRSTGPASVAAGGMNEGDAYHLMLTFILNKNARILNEFIHYNGTAGSVDHDALVTQLQIDF